MQQYLVGIFGCLIQDISLSPCELLERTWMRTGWMLLQQQQQQQILLILSMLLQQIEWFDAPMLVQWSIQIYRTFYIIIIV
jgi:hypothetical protein